MANPIEHIVIIVKENHTFDNYFGTSCCLTKKCYPIDGCR